MLSPPPFPAGSCAASCGVVHGMNPTGVVVKNPSKNLQQNGHEHLWTSENDPFFLHVRAMVYKSFFVTIMLWVFIRSTTHVRSPGRPPLLSAIRAAPDDSRHPLHCSLSGLYLTLSFGAYKVTTTVRTYHTARSVDTMAIVVTRGAQLSAATSDCRRAIPTPKSGRGCHAPGAP